MTTIAKCIKAIPGEYITEGQEYFVTMLSDCVDIRRTSNGITGSYIAKRVWQKAVENGSVEILSLADVL